MKITYLDQKEFISLLQSTIYKKTVSIEDDNGSMGTGIETGDMVGDQFISSGEVFVMLKPPITEADEG